MDNESKILKYIILTQIKGLGPITQNAFLDYGDIETTFEAGYEDLMSADEMRLIGKKRINSFISQRDDKNLWINAKDILGAAKALNIDVIIREDRRFPERFENLPDMPVVLYAKGSLKINEFEDSIGIVGARRCTPKGKQMAINIAEEAAGSNAAVISGMAKGIDSYAHTAAVKMCGYTIAVLGNGADICYPKEHMRLYEEIAEHSCILSEYPPGTLPREYNFPKRNRLIAALSDKLYVIDAGRNSGTVSTAESSRKYGREVVELLPDY